MLEFRERINLLEENCTDPDFIENKLRLYYEDLIQQFVKKKELFKEYERILSDSTIDIDNEVKKLSNPLSNEINIQRYANHKNTILNENELKLSEIVVDALFSDNIYNVWVNINELLKYDSYLSNDEKILSDENRKLYQLILDIDSCSFEQKIFIYKDLERLIFGIY